LTLYHQNERALEAMFAVELVDFDDGHQPALVRNSTHDGTKLALNRNKQSSKFLAVFDGLLPPPWPQRMYEYAVKLGQPWGAYVQTCDLIEYEKDGADLNNGLAMMLEYVESIWQADPERAFSVCATYMLVMVRGRGLIGSDLKHIHGTAVWCLNSGVTNSVEYHIDYAELYRYETNVIHPPLYAGTCHVTPIESSGERIQGGDFCVNSGGIEHYQKFGYKAKLQGSEALEEDIKTNGEWHTVKYLTNRGILHDGDLPHLSTPVASLPLGARRVILGFNCFSQEVGECCIRAPEHSRAFNRTVKLYQAIASVTGSQDAFSDKYNTSSDSLGSSNTLPRATNQQHEAKTSKLSAREIMKNPALAKLLILAAKKVKEKEKEKKELFN